MSKYVDAGKLIKFKEVLADMLVSSQGICTYQDCKDIAEREALLLIATLQQEQPEVDLDAEIAIYLNRNVLNRINNSDIIEDFTTMEAGELARHFYELGFNAKREE